jgi:hypothetical protein
VGMERLEAATRRETLLVVSPEAAPAELLERVDDARRIGATILALDRGDPELGALAHEALAVPADTSPLSFDAAQHLVSAAAGEPDRLRETPRRGSHRASGRLPAQRHEASHGGASLRTRPGLGGTIAPRPRNTAINSRPCQEMVVSWFAVNGMLLSARSWITCG